MIRKKMRNSVKKNWAPWASLTSRTMACCTMALTGARARWRRRGATSCGLFGRRRKVMTVTDSSWKWVVGDGHRFGAIQASSESEWWWWAKWNTMSKSDGEMTIYGDAKVSDWRRWNRGWWHDGDILKMPARRWCLLIKGDGMMVCDAAFYNPTASDSKGEIMAP